MLIEKLEAIKWTIPLMMINQVEEMLILIDLLLTMLRKTAVTIGIKANLPMLIVVFCVMKKNSLMILNQFDKVL